MPYPTPRDKRAWELFVHSWSAKISGGPLTEEANLDLAHEAYEAADAFDQVHHEMLEQQQRMTELKSHLPELQPPLQAELVQRRGEDGQEAPKDEGCTFQSP